MELPLCTAPFHSILIDTNKGLRPCCAWQGKYLGNLKEDNLSETLDGPEWQLIRSQLSRGEWPKGCLGCKLRELQSGWSVRKEYLQWAAGTGEAWSQGLTEIEFNSSNYCNLACLHCSADFSSKWVGYEQKLQKAGFNKLRSRGCQLHPTDAAQTLQQMAALDLSRLRTLRLKGGEPMINPEVPALLGHLAQNGWLQNIDVYIVTNASRIPEGLFELLAQARSVTFNLSVDGFGKVQEYIRWGDSGLDKIEEFVRHFSGLPVVWFEPTVSVMAYNIFNLSEVANWWSGIQSWLGPKGKARIDFGLHVWEPRYLAVNVLREPTRKRLIAHYASLGNADYSHVIQSLQNPYAGPALHNDFLRFSRLMDSFRGISIEDFIPELSEELMEDASEEMTQNQASLGELDALLEKGGPEAGLLFRRALLKRESGDAEGAFADLSQAVRLDPDLFHLVPEHWWQVG